MTTEIIESYRKALLDPRWDLKRKEILERDGHRCRNCPKQDGLHVHHRQYHVNAFSGIRNEPWDYDNQYLITLCASCHELGHRLYKVPVFNV